MNVPGFQELLEVTNKRISLRSELMKQMWNVLRI